MPQGSTYDEKGNLVWKFDICCEFDCNEEYAKVDCKSDFTKPPCIFHGEHRELNLREGMEYYDGEEPENGTLETEKFEPDSF